MRCAPSSSTRFSPSGRTWSTWRWRQRPVRRRAGPGRRRGRPRRHVRGAAGAGADIFAFTVTNVFESVPELAVFSDRTAALNDRIRAVARRHDAVLIEMWHHPVRLRPNLMSADGIHFAMEGHAALAAEIVKALGARSAQRAET
ncbi:hypothetical protein ACFQV4_19975 [Streptomyces thermocarboxydus]